MKIHLVNPPQPYLVNPGTQMSLGLLYIAAVLLREGYEVDLHELSSFPVPEAAGYLMEVIFSEEDPDIVLGFTGTSLDIPIVNLTALELKEVCRAHNIREPVIIVGGAGATLSPEYYDLDAVDCIILGEGEKAVLDVIGALAKGHTITSRTVGPYSFIQHLDSLPFPARYLLEKQGGSVFMSGDYIGEGSTVFLTARGCPFQCAFCASCGMWKRVVRYRSIESVVAEMKEVVHDYGIRQFRFSDDTITIQRSRLLELCVAIKSLGVEVAWRVSIRTVPNDLELFEALRDAGCREASFGIESGDQNVLNTLCKGTTILDNGTAIRNATAAGLKVRALMMIGTPGESRDTVQKNIEFLEGVPYDTVCLTSFVPLPGSPIWNNPEQHGVRILDKDMKNYNIYFWTSEGESELVDLMEINGMTLGEVRANKEAFREYVKSTGKLNTG